MTKITETELKNKVASLREKISEVWYNPATWGQAGGGNTAGGAATGNPNLAKQGKKAGATQQSAKPAPVAPAGAPKVAYDKGYPEATVKELQTKLNAAGEKLTVDGKMGPATRDAQARHPEITTQPAAAQAVGADINSANNTPPPAAAPQTSMNTDDEAGAHAFDPTWGGTVATGGQDVAPNANATWDNNKQTAVANAAPAPAPAQAAMPAATPQTSMSTDNEAGAQAFDPTWGGTKAAQDTRTGLQKFLPNFMGGQSAPVAANQNATWNNAQQAAVSNKPAPVAESVGFRNDELSRIVSLVHHR